jgi:hypothetical protein
MEKSKQKLKCILKYRIGGLCPRRLVVQHCALLLAGPIPLRAKAIRTHHTPISYSKREYFA